jgi:hypothetical protein
MKTIEELGKKELARLERKAEREKVFSDLMVVMIPAIEEFVKSGRESLGGRGDVAYDLVGWADGRVVVHPKQNEVFGCGHPLDSWISVDVGVSTCGDKRILHLCVGCINSNHKIAVRVLREHLRLPADFSLVFVGNGWAKIRHFKVTNFVT